MDKPAQIALLIDADNATAARIDVILGELSRLGETNVRRAYGNWTKTGLKSWQEVLHENAIRPVQQFDPSKGKNASDIALAVDAVEILHTQRPDAFALVSSDADFTPLVMHLREHGAHVYGFGDAKTPAPFQSACTRFLVLNRLPSPSGQADVVPLDSVASDAVAPLTEAAAAGAATGSTGSTASRSRRATAKATSSGPGGTASDDGHAGIHGEGHDQEGCVEGHREAGRGAGARRPARPADPQPAAQRRQARQAAPGSRRGRRRRLGLGPRRHRGQPHRQPVLVRPAQLRLRQAEQAARGHRPVRHARRRRSHDGGPRPAWRVQQRSHHWERLTSTCTMKPPDKGAERRLGTP